jgi:septum formation topological specificity factor MinE
MKKEIFNNDEIITKNDIYIKAFENELANVCAKMHDYKALKIDLVNLYNKYVQNDTKRLEVTVDKQKVCIESRAYFETLIATLKDKFKKNMAVHKQDNKKIMTENKWLIWNINELKRECKFYKEKEKLGKIELAK